MCTHSHSHTDTHQVEPAADKLYACLVDAENTQPSKLAAIVEELNGYGELVVRRVYGDFSSPQLTPWRAVSNELSFRPQAQFAIVSGKGTSDMAMAMDAIDLVHGGGGVAGRGEGAARQHRVQRLDEALAEHL